MRSLCVMRGDGIGKEVIPGAVTVLQAVIPDLNLIEADAGWHAFEQTGHSVPSQTLTLLRECGAGLFGAVQSPTHKVDGYRSAILTMRQELQLYGNIRPIITLPQVSPKPNIDMIVVRENSEGLYIGDETSDGDTAVARRVITRTASDRIAALTASICNRLNREHVTIAHKANVLPLTDGLFRDVVRARLAADCDAKVAELLADVAALKMVGEPERFDVLVTTNLFGDILSDAAAHWGGGLGYAPSINIGDSCAVAEPVHGSAPDIAGQGLANPIAAVLSAALLAEYVWDDLAAAQKIRRAVNTVLTQTNPLPKTNVTRTIGDLLLAAL